MSIFIKQLLQHLLVHEVFTGFFGNPLLPGRYISCEAIQQHNYVTTPPPEATSLQLIINDNH